jgi:hypothetical protein
MQPEYETQLEVFFSKLMDGCSTSKAAREAGLSPREILKRRKEDGEFDEACKMSEGVGTDELKDEAFERALNGTDKEVIGPGGNVVTLKVKNDQTLLEVLERREPTKQVDTTVPDLAKALMEVARMRLSEQSKDRPAIEAEVVQLG